MNNFHFTNKAVEDLSSIWEYTADAWSEAQADKYYNILVSACQKLATNIGLGYRYDEISPGLLGFKAGKHIIFYQIISDGDILIIRILHERMDLKSRIKN